MASAGLPFKRVLDPIDRVTEILFGLIMVLTITSTLSVLTAGQADVRTMILGALGCNLAWGIIDAGMYLMNCLDERGRNHLLVHAVRKATAEDADRLILDALPDTLASTLSPQDTDAIRRKLLELPTPPPYADVRKEDLVGALAVCLLVFLSAFPVVVPFLFTSNVQLALRTSNGIAIAMLFLCGYVFAQQTGYRPWFTGLLLVVVGCALTGVAILLGG